MTDQKIHRIAVLPGDGIGREVMAAVRPLFTAWDLPIQWQDGDIGWACWEQEGTPIPPRTWDLIHQSDALLLGAVTSKPAREAMAALKPALKNHVMSYVSPIIQLRQGLDLYANVRPCFSIQPQDKPFNFCIIRENTEGLYAGFDYYPMPAALHAMVTKNPRWASVPMEEMSGSLRLQTKAGLLRLFVFAFEHARRHAFTRVTLADKPNVLRESARLARDCFETVAARYPAIQADILNVDAVAFWMVKRPESFGVIVAENMFGDILSDVGASVMGGLGLAPSANIGEHGCYFEPVHGSAPRLTPGQANPSAMFLSLSLLLSHLGFQAPAAQLAQAVKQVIQAGRYITRDLGGAHTTQAMADAIIAGCG